MGSAIKEEILHKMEAMNDGAHLSLRLSPTFGADLVIIQLNPSHKEKGQKKYSMWCGKDDVEAKAKSPFLSSNKAKTIAAWVAERAPQWVS
jgi:hypothetical protein